ncbi:hypothetical protein [Xylanibacter oryzae]|uniref:hypothetical protein n=1 Tax=Xylanibacter oryzae TaxID=185293 RepID=UPI0004BA507A|nr:hypothetical protein [Xylanibacter oryzae]
MIKLEEKIIEKLNSNLGLSEEYYNNSPRYKNSYLKYYKYNLQKGGLGMHEKEFKNGNGSELSNEKKYPAKISPAKMEALRSSSAFTVNLFGIEEKIHIYKNNLVPSCDYKLSYEAKRKTIKGGPANIDVFLENNDCDIYVEVKMLEPFTYKYMAKDKKVSSSYCSYQIEGNYCNNASYPLFQPIFKHFHEESNPIAFDTFQMLKHLLGLYNYYSSKSVNNKKVYLINCHWKFEDIVYQGSRRSKTIEYIKSNYEKSKLEYEKYTKTFKEAFAKIGVQLELLNLNHEEIMDMLHVDPSGYMKRYHIEHLQ